MAVKLMHYYTIIPSQNEAYKEFIIQKFIPEINRLGLHTVAGWSVLVGSYSEVILETASSDLDQLETALKSEEYRHLKSDLLNYIKKYKTKVLTPLKKGRNYSIDFVENAIKFNQVWDVITRKEDDYQRYTQFMFEEFYPVLEEIGVHIAGEWEVLIGEGPRTICEGRVMDVCSLINALEGTKFRQAKEKLKTYVENYESRILSFHIKRQKHDQSETYHIIDK
ncbi:MAG: hypothetical protein ACNA7H_06585 [Desulfotignum sp.]